MEESQENQINNKVGRPIITPWRHSEDGTFNNKPTSETYFNDYYNNNLKNVYTNCPFCNRSILKATLPRHIKHGKNV